MPAGLQIWAPDGRLRVDTTTVTALLIGQVSVGGEGAPQDGSIYDSRLGLGTPFFIVVSQSLVDRDGYNAQFSFSGANLTWHFKASGSAYYQRPPSTVIYGIR